ncbi:hypothetical protein [Pseudomonas fluorescens]|uniref:hypothetical protein n=1 Tax=Pseudomonas fluorescens TaxID=294 RepID=UPI000A42A040|nr:hypothetical protein [Pseudomonas fluorescens]
MTANIKRFDEITKKLLVALYESFPAAAFLGPNELGLTNEQPAHDQLGRWSASEEWNELDNEVKRAMLWLVEEGFVHDRQYKISASHVLTAQGFIALEQMDSAYKAPVLTKTSL